MQVTLVSLGLDPVWEYKVVPRGRSNAYLTMNCTNDSPYTLLPGEIKVGNNTVFLFLFLFWLLFLLPLLSCK